MWQYMQTCNNQKLNLSLDNLYLTLNKKTGLLHKQYKQPHKQGMTTHTNSTAYHKFVISELQQ